MSGEQQVIDFEAKGSASIFCLCRCGRLALADSPVVVDENGEPHVVCELCEAGAVPNGNALDEKSDNCLNCQNAPGSAPHSGASGASLFDMGTYGLKASDIVSGGCATGDGGAVLHGCEPPRLSETSDDGRYGRPCPGAGRRYAKSRPAFF